MKAGLFVLFFVMCFAATGQQSVQFDTAAIQPRFFNKSTLTSYKAQKAFQYEALKEPVTSWWDRFWSWFWFKVSQLLSTKEGKTTAWTLLIFFVAGMVALVVFKVMGMNKNGLFSRKSGKGLQYTIHSDDINSIDFDEAISTAEAVGNYRLAVRLLYLQVLKTISDKGFIDWQINKTNTDYILEVSNRSWLGVFKELTNTFEYTWYGETSTNREEYYTLQQKFQTFNRNL